MTRARLLLQVHRMSIFLLCGQDGKLNFSLSLLPLYLVCNYFPMERNGWDVKGFVIIFSFVPSPVVQKESSG